MALPQKQRLFVSYYLGKAKGNGTLAARLAGFSSPRQMATRLLSKASIREAIEEKVSAVAMEAEEVLARMSALATSSLDDFLVFAPGVVDDPALDLARGKRRGKIGSIRKLKRTTRTIYAGKDNPPEVETTVEIELHDAHKALDMLAKVHGLYKAPIAPPEERRPRIEIPRRDERSDAG